MACSYNIRLKLFKGSEAGGTLTYLGFSNTVGGPYGSGGSVVPPSTADTTIPYPCEENVDVTGFIPGYYKFKYEGPTCAGGTTSQEAILQVLSRADAGDPNTVEFCVNDSNSENLNDHIDNETLGGDWSVNPASQGTDADNALSGNLLDLSQMTTPGTYFFDYDTGLIGAEPGYELSDCVDCYDKTTLTVIITAASDAGTAQNISTCYGCSVNLIDYLSLADPGGTWTQISGPAASISGGDQGTINPTAGTRVFRYTVGAGNCQDTEDIEVTTFARANAGTPSNMNICSDYGSTIDLFSRLTGEQVGGYWEVIGSSPQSGTVDLINGTYTPAIGDDGVFTFRYNVIQPGTVGECSTQCEDYADVVVTVGDTGYAGEDIGLSGCINDSWNLLTELQNVANDPITTGQFWFLGYDSNCGGNNSSGTFQANGTSGTYSPMTNFGPTLTVGAMQGWGCWQFMHYTPSQGASCNDMAFIEITMGPCCDLDYNLNYSAGSNELCITNLTDCDDCGCNPDVDWYYSQNGTNYTLITGTSGNCLNLNQGSGTYKSVVTCGSCTTEKYYNHTSPNTCSVTASITDNGSTMTANQSGCSGAVSYQWAYSSNGSTNWINLGTSQIQSKTYGDGHYRLRIDCPDDQGCFDFAYFEEISGCTLNAGVITENNGVLTANPNGGTPPYSYQWRYSPNGNQGSYTDISGATSQSYTPVQSGYFEVFIVDSNGCQDESQIQFTLPGCAITIDSLTELQNGDLQATYSGNQNTVTIRWQYSTSGTGWTNLPQFDGQITITPDQGNGVYRIIIWDGPEGSNCFDADQISWTSGCNGSVVISENSCGNNTVDAIFLIDESVSVDSGEWNSMKSNIDATIDALDALSTVDARYMIIQWSGTGQQNLAVPFTSDPATAKNFTRTFSGNTDMSDATAWLYGELQAGNISFRAGAARHLLYFTDGVETDNNCTSANGNFRKCVGGTLVYDDYDLMQSTYSTIHSVVRYLNGFANQDEPSNAVCAAIASAGGSWTGDVDIPNDPGALRPRRMYSLSFGDPVPDMPYDITCTELNSVVTGCSGTVVYTWQYRENAGDNWSPLPGGGGSSIQVDGSGQYRLLVDCGGCDYISNIITIS